MHKVNDLFHKRVIDQNSGDAVATVRDVVLSADGQRIVALIINGGDRSHGEQVIRWDAVVSVGEYVVVDGAQPLSGVNEDPEVAELRQDAQQITGKAVMSTTGERLGT